VIAAYLGGVASGLVLAVVLAIVYSWLWSGEAYALWDRIKKFFGC
jgi:hypothetical protein